MDRNLIDYLPPVLKEYKEIKAVTETEQLEFDLLWDTKQFVEKNLYIVDAAEYGIGRLEKPLGIPTRSAESLEDRKSRLILRTNEQPPFTIRILEHMLETICGIGGYSVDLRHLLLLLNVQLKNVSNRVYIDVYHMLNRTVPANIVTDLLVEQDLPAAAVYIGAHEAAAIRKTTFENELFYKDAAETKAVSGFGITGVYRCTTINT